MMGSKLGFAMDRKDGNIQETLSVPPKTELSLKLLKKVNIPDAARPEIVVTDSRVFIIYVDKSGGSKFRSRKFKLKIFDRDMNNEISTKTLVSSTHNYGSPTDIRIISDNEFVYVFYETAAKTKKTYLFGAKYRLDDDFKRVAYTDTIAESMFFRIAPTGKEKFDDPAPMIRGNRVYVMTRYKSSFSNAGDTKYKIRIFDKNLKKLSEIELDVSSVGAGEGRQSSIVYDNGYYYLVAAKTTGNCGKEEFIQWRCPSDILMVKLDERWNVVDSKIIAEKERYTEAFVTVLMSDDYHFYITYNQVILREGMASVIKIYDKQWNSVHSEEYKTVKGRARLRPSMFVTSDRIYAGNNSGDTSAEIYVYGKVMRGYKGLPVRQNN
jgi:hypothetical protein